MKRSFSKLSLLALPLVVTACQDYEPFDDGAVKKNVAAREFTENFEARYGTIDPNHNWGFSPLGDGVSAEAGTRTNLDNKNQWESHYHMQIPGWPDVYYDKDGVLHNDGYHSCENGHKNHKYETSNPTLDQCLPAGDVTDEEIQYVSWWFRTHKDPGGIEMHLTDFYLQEISSDNDRDESGKRITEYKVEENGTTTNSGNFKFTLNKLDVKLFEEQDGEQYDHAKQFNNDCSNNLYDEERLYCGNDTTKIWDNQLTYPIRLIEFYQSSGTEGFRVLNNQQNGDNYKYNYRLVHLNFVGKSGRVYDGYYIGFDYDFDNVIESGKREYYEADGYYSNWIIKLSPAEPRQNDNYSCRVMCEDLGNTYDFDFNDVVFDVTRNEFNVTPTITIRAAGGTMPIWVGKDPRTLSDPDKYKYEVHHLLGQTTSTTPVNVGGKNSATAPIASYHLDNDIENADQVTIYVENEGVIVALDAATSYKKDNVSKAPQKFAVPVGVRWMREEKQIESGYPHFKDWVRNANFTTEDGKPWYHNDCIKDPKLIYPSGEVGFSGTGESGGTSEPEVTDEVVLLDKTKEDPQNSNQLNFTFSWNEAYPELRKALADGLTTIKVECTALQSDLTVKVSYQDVNNSWQSISLGEFTVNSGVESFTYNIPDDKLDSVKTCGFILDFCDNTVSVKKVSMIR